MRQSSAILPLLIGFLIIDRLLSSELELEIAEVSIVQHSADQYAMQKCYMNAIGLSVEADQLEPGQDLQNDQQEP